ncbi:TPA: phage DNA ejection protein [Escherichia coli]
MATWQLGGLPSMAPQNDNAPRSSVPQPVQYQQQPNVGLMALQGIRGVAEINQQARQQQRKAEFQKAYAGAFESGDRNKMRSLISEYPEEFESVQKGMGFIDDDQRNSIGHLATSAQIASSLGTGAFGKFIADNEDEMRRLGISPESVAEMHVNDPQGFQRLAGSMALFSLGHEKYFDIKDRMEGRDIERGKLAETIRSNQAGEALTARGQDIQIRGQNISAQNAALSREIQRAELQEKALDRQIARESNQLKLEELKQKQADVRQKADIARADRQAAAQGAVDTFSTALDSLNEIEQSPGLSKAVGIRSAFPTVPGSDAANFEARLDTFKAQTFLPMVQSLKGMGALSDAEGKKLSDAVGALSPKMSEKAFRDSIGKIRNQLESKLSTVKKQFDYQEPVQNTPAQQPTTGSNFSSLWGD